MAKIIKYELFDEFNHETLYGASLKDALEHAGEIRHCGTWSHVSQQRTGDRPLGAFSVLCYEHCPSSTRGGVLFERAIVETANGTRLSIDAINKGEAGDLESL